MYARAGIKGGAMQSNNAWISSIVVFLCLASLLTTQCLAFVASYLTSELRN